MNKYDPLYHFLKKDNGSHVKVTFKEIEKIRNDQLPISASKYREWWANGGHIQANAWLEAGYKVDKVSLGSCVEFVKND
jgi:FAD synthase